MRDYLVIFIGSGPIVHQIYDVIKVDKESEDRIFYFNQSTFNSMEEINNYVNKLTVNGDLARLVHQFGLKLLLEAHNENDTLFVRLTSPVLNEGYSELRSFQFRVGKRNSALRIFQKGKSPCGDCPIHVLCIEKPPHNSIIDIINSLV